MLTLIATLLVAAPTGPVRQTQAVPARDPAVEISLNNDGNYAPGGPVNVHVKTGDDGYLLVFRVDGDGQIRVLFPLDPDQSAFVRGGQDYALRGRDNDQSFFADSRTGTGMVYAAVSHENYQFGSFSSNGRWDYDALQLPDSTTDDESALTAIVAQMTGRTRFEYDAVAYQVQQVGTVTAMDGQGYYPGLYDPYYNPAWRCLGCGWGYPGADFGIGLTFGYSPYYDPFLYSPWDIGYGGYGYGGYGYGGYYGGYYPGYGRGVGVRRPLPAGARPRPRQGAVYGTESGRQGNVYGRGVGTRARPRPDNMVVMPRRNESQVRPALRQPRQYYQPRPQSQGRPDMQRARPEPQSRPEVQRARPEPQSRPVYREPPRSEPSGRSAPSPRPSQGRGGGHRGL
jgi:hypothetical protein